MSNSCDPMTVAYQLLCPWDFPDKNTGVGCHFLLQKVSMGRIQGKGEVWLYMRGDRWSFQVWRRLVELMGRAQFVEQEERGRREQVQRQACLFLGWQDGEGILLWWCRWFLAKSEVEDEKEDGRMEGNLRKVEKAWNIFWREWEKNRVAKALLGLTSINLWWFHYMRPLTTQP